MSGKRFLAFFCRICPLCIAARLRPNSKWAGFVKSLEKICPFCRAYKRLKN